MPHHAAALGSCLCIHQSKRGGPGVRGAVVPGDRAVSLRGDRRLAPWASVDAAAPRYEPLCGPALYAPRRHRLGDRSPVHLPEPRTHGLRAGVRPPERAGPRPPGRLEPPDRLRRRGGRLVPGRRSPTRRPRRPCRVSDSTIVASVVVLVGARGSCSWGSTGSGPGLPRSGVTRTGGYSSYVGPSSVSWTSIPRASRSSRRASARS